MITLAGSRRNSLGYLPFLGHAHLGQSEDPWQERATALEAQISTLLDQAKGRPNSADLIQHGNYCSALVAKLRTSSSLEDLASASASIEKCMKALQAELDKPISVEPEAAGAPGQSTSTLTYALGALAAIGLIAFIATR